MNLAEDSDDDGCNLRTTIVEEQLKKLAIIEWESWFFLFSDFCLFRI